jgi:hypothetical protein
MGRLARIPGKVARNGQQHQHKACIRLQRVCFSYFAHIRGVAGVSLAEKSRRLADLQTRLARAATSLRLLAGGSCHVKDRMDGFGRREITPASLSLSQLGTEWNDIFALVGIAPTLLDEVGRRKMGADSQSSAPKSNILSSGSSGSRTPFG